MGKGVIEITEEFHLTPCICRSAGEGPLLAGCGIKNLVMCLQAIFRISTSFRRIALLEAGYKQHEQIARNFLMPGIQ